MPVERPGLIERALLATMAATAGVSVELTGPGSVTRDWVWPFAAAFGGLIASTYVVRRPHTWTRDSSVAAMLGAVVGLWLHGFEPGGVTAALDVLLLGASAGMLPVLVAWSWHRRVAGLTALLSAFVVIVETSYSGQATTELAVLVYAVAAACWLARQAGAPLRAGVAVAVACVLIGGAIGLRASGLPMARAMSGFLPASGGTGDGSASARAGVGSGPDEVAGDDAASNGYDQTDRYSESAQDGLYDLFVEAYGQPAVSKPSDRMVGLKPKDTKVVAGNDQQDLRSGRLFELRRKATPPAATAIRPAGDTLLYVEGRTPLRLRLTTYDAYEHGIWQEAPARKLPASLRRIDREHWLSFIDRPDFSGAAADQAERIKIAALPGDVLPTPPATLRFKLGRADRPDFFRESRGGLLTLARASIPPGSVLDVEFPTLDPAAQNPGELATVRAGRPTADAPLDAAERRLVAQWTTGVAPGWPQVNAVVSGVRGRGHFVRGAAVDVADPLHAFLVDGRPGDDALFASAVALVLRSLGYHTRLVGGLYARPDAYDRPTGQTPVLRGDVHLWPEVRLPTGAWVALEPTPGYTLLGPRPTAWGTALAWAKVVIDGAWRHWPALLIAAAGLTGVALVRRRILDAAEVLFWRMRPPGDPARLARRTAALLDRRARRWRSGRPDHRTRSAWLAGHGVSGEFCRLVDWAEYAPATPPPIIDARTACSHAVRSLTRDCFSPHV